MRRAIIVSVCFFLTLGLIASYCNECFRLRTLNAPGRHRRAVAAFLVQHRRTAQIEAERQASVAESSQHTQRLFAAYGELVSVMVQREMEKPGLGDKVVCTPDQSTTIYRFRTNPEGKDRAASCRPPSVLVPGSALRSCRHGALSSAQATSHRSATRRFEQ